MRTDPAMLTGAYVLDALTGDERSGFESHLDWCTDCTREVGELRATAARLGSAAADTPPAELRGRVLTEIRQTRQAPPQVIPLSQHRSPSGPARSTSGWWRGRAALATAAAAVVLGGALGVTAMDASDDLRDARQVAQQATARQVALAEVLAAPDARLHTVAGPLGMRATAVVSHRSDTAAFLGTGAQPPGAHHVYQLWFIGPGGFTSAGLLALDGAGHVAPVVAGVPSGATGLGVTVEPEGGSAQPTTDPILRASIV